jgi:DNA-binding response OmpR family regulator
MPTIALVDDDENILASLKIFFEAEGHTVRAYHDGATALSALAEAPPDIAILDIKMPRMDGIEVLRRLRQTSNLPVIFLTSKDDEMDEVVGFNVGADDYVAKPFRARPLLERVKALLRRPAADDDAADILEVEGIRIDRVRHEVRVDGEELILTPTEFRLLWTLGRQRGRTFSRNELLDCCRGEDANSMERTIDVHIRALRKKLDARMDLIETVRGIGYRFRPER